MFVFLFILVVIFSVIFHEYGHYKAAKRCGIGVQSFNLGMGPLLYKKRYNDTDWCLRLIPTGGSCGIETRQLLTLSAKQRIGIYFAGPLNNVILSFIAFIPYFLMLYFQKNGVINFTAIVNIIPAFFASCAGSLSTFGLGLSTMISVTGPTLVESSGIMNNMMASVSQLEYAITLFNMIFTSNILLALFNLLPIPALDGGQIVMTLPELVNKPMDRKRYDVLNYVFYLVFIAITVLYYAKDFLLMLDNKR